MSAQYTPGPWKFYSKPSRSGPSWNMKHIIGNDGAELCRTAALTEPTDTANARLIAAAPELLEACKALVKWSGDFPSVANGVKLNFQPFQNAFQAIAKAEGK